MAVGTGIVNGHDVTNLDGRQAALHGELVVILAQTAGDIIDMIQNGSFLAQNRDVMVSAIHGRAHQVSGAGIQTHILPVDVLLVQYRGDQVAVGSQHKPAQFGEDSNVIHPLGLQDTLIAAADTLAYHPDITTGLLRAVVHADAAGKIDKGDMGTGGIAQPDSQAEHLRGQLRVVFIGAGVGGQECVKAKVLGSQLHQPHNGSSHLILRHAILGIPGHIHNGIAQAEGAAGIIPQADCLRHIPHFCQEIHIGGIVQIDIGPHLQSLAHILLRGHIGGEHHIVTGDSGGLCQHQLRVGGAVTAAALLLQNPDDKGIGGCLDGKVLLESLIPCKSLLQSPGITADAGLVIHMEGCRDLGGDFLCLFQGNKGGFLHLFSSNSVFFWKL